MKHIAKYVEQIKEELDGATDYAERYVYQKSLGDPSARKWQEFAQDELKHAMGIHDMAVAEVKRLEGVYEPTVEMREAWEKSHKEYVEQTAKVKMMLAM